MLNNNLIKKCTCGNDSMFSNLFVNMLEVVSCGKCDVLHQYLEGWTEEKYHNFYKTDYHTEYQQNRGTMTYKERYEHDCRVSDMRLDTYKLPEMSVGLDIGSSNSAFVHRARVRNIQCLGLEPGKDIGDDSVTIRGTLESAYLNPEHFDFQNTYRLQIIRLFLCCPRYWCQQQRSHVVVLLRWPCPRFQNGKP